MAGFFLFTAPEDSGVTPAKAGVPLRSATTRKESWIPAFAGMTPVVGGGK